MSGDIAIDTDRVIQRLAERIAGLEVLCAQQATAISQLVEQQQREAGRQHAAPASDPAVRAGRAGADAGGGEAGARV